MYNALEDPCNTRFYPHRLLTLMRRSPIPHFRHIPTGGESHFVGGRLTMTQSHCPHQDTMAGMIVGVRQTFRMLVACSPTGFHGHVCR